MGYSDSRQEQRIVLQKSPQDALWEVEEVRNGEIELGSDRLKCRRLTGLARGQENSRAWRQYKQFATRVPIYTLAIINVSTATSGRSAPNFPSLS